MDGYDGMYGSFGGYGNMMGMQRPGPVPGAEQNMSAPGVNGFDVRMGQAGGVGPINMRMAHAQVTLSKHRGPPLFPHSNPSRNLVLPSA
jgi:hypothetical protein